MTSAPSVTTEIIRGTGRPTGGYWLHGERMPSVTTVLGAFKDPGGLTQWAYKVGLRQGYAHGKESVTPPGLYAEKAAEIGSAVHHAAERYALGYTDDPHASLESWEDWGELDAGQREKARTSLGAFLRWWQMAAPEVVATEIPMVSADLRTGGTVDLVARVAGRLQVLDFKTAKRVYPEQKIQLGAYAQLWDGEHPFEPIEGAAVLRFDKASGGFDHADVGDLEPWKEAFRLMRRLYTITKGK